MRSADLMVGSREGEDRGQHFYAHFSFQFRRDILMMYPCKFEKHFIVSIYLGLCFLLPGLLLIDQWREEQGMKCGKKTHNCFLAN